MRRLPKNTGPIGTLARRSRTGQENPANPGLDKMDRHTHLEENLSKQASAAHDEIPEAAESTAVLSGNSKHVPIFLEDLCYAKMYININEF